jgi:hypothetical protein
MCLACEMFWMVAEEPPAPEPKRRSRKAKAQPDAGFACDAPAEGTTTPIRPRATRSKKRTPRVESERQP